MEILKVQIIVPTKIFDSIFQICIDEVVKAIELNQFTLYGVMQTQ